MTSMLVIGGSKGIGLETVKRALDEGCSVKAMASSAHELQLAHERLEKISGDALERRDLVTALDGVDTVVTALGLPLNRQTITRPVNLISASTAALLDVMKEGEARRLIAVTRPGILTRGSRRGTYRALLEPSSWRNGVISRADVADYIVSAIDDPATIGTSPVLVN